MNPQHSRGFQQSCDFQIARVQWLESDVGGELSNLPLRVRIIAGQEHHRLEAIVFWITCVGKILEPVGVETFNHPRAWRPLRDHFSPRRGVAHGQFEPGAGRELERIGAIHQNLACQIAAFQNGGFRRVPRGCEDNYFTENGRFGIRAGTCIGAAGVEQTTMFRIIGIAYSEFYFVSGLGPAFAKRTANISCADDPKNHNLFKFIVEKRLRLTSARRDS